ncbi:MAG TPA: hypothetical protein VNT51_11765 [Miltoncostaeaceae bacterium]|nr:hypothetical protein [Miltoncostaeaceae bacterium]
MPSIRPARGRGARRLAAVAATALLAAPAVAAAQDTTPFPRTLALYLVQQNLPGGGSCATGARDVPFDGSTLGRYDMVVIDMEWSNPERRACYRPKDGSADVFASIRAAAGNRPVKIVPYVNPVDRPIQSGDRGYYAYRYDLWGCANALSFGDCQFPGNWYARTKRGKYYQNWSGTRMTNLTNAPQAGTMPAGTAKGTYANFPDYFGAWVRARWTSGWSGTWDAVYLDVWGDRIWSNTSPWDPHWPAGKDLATSEIYKEDGLWQRGIATGNDGINQAPPGVLVGNNTQSRVTAPGLSGRVWESFADPDLGRQFTWDVPPYVDAGGPNPLGYATSSLRGPTRYTVTQLAVDKKFSDPGSLTTTDYRRARHDLTAALLGNGYWGPASYDYGGLPWFDEMDGGCATSTPVAGCARLGNGYLGQPVDPSPSWAEVSAAYVPAPIGTPTDSPVGTKTYTGQGMLPGGAYRRDFANGIAIVNPTSGAVTVTPGNAYRRLAGTQQPQINSGAAVPAGSTVTIPARDGIILLNG